MGLGCLLALLLIAISITFTVGKLAGGRIVMEICKLEMEDVALALVNSSKREGEGQGGETGRRRLRNVLIGIAGKRVEHREYWNIVLEEVGVKLGKGNLGLGEGGQGRLADGRIVLKKQLLKDEQVVRQHILEDLFRNGGGIKGGGQGGEGRNLSL